jgi:hypothetical protein
MIANALIVTIAILLALVFWLMSELNFLVPYRHVLLHQYGELVLISSGVAFTNIFAAVYAIERRFFLKDTGRKLSHIDTQALLGDFRVPHPEVPRDAD